MASLGLTALRDNFWFWTVLLVYGSFAPGQTVLVPLCIPPTGRLTGQNGLVCLPYLLLLLPTTYMLPRVDFYYSSYAIPAYYYSRTGQLCIPHNCWSPAFPAFAFLFHYHFFLDILLLLHLWVITYLLYYHTIILPCCLCAFLRVLSLPLLSLFSP